ncbi:MAG TPA: VOC family protein [Candidatus Dormibacteraeota bacterium]|nr:VOC family protein [Candidatus Dormibacteraeota bacterium]
MAETKTFVVNSPAWVDLSSTDPAASRDYYAKLFGWKVDVAPDPGAGGYALATIDGKNVAGIGGSQDPNAPSAWMVYIGTKDANATAAKVEAAGGKVIAAPFDVMDQGRMAVFQDPAGAFISVWQPKIMQGSDVMNAPNTFAWAELNARGIDKARPFYGKVFGWKTKESPMGEGQPMYTEFLNDGNSIAGGTEMMPMVPAEVPSFWQIYFAVADVDKSFKKALEGGGKELVEPMDFPGGRFAIVQDPQGAVFGLMKMQQA